MNLRLFGISGRTTLEPLPEQELSASWAEDPTHRWIDIEAASEQELQELLEPLELPAVILRACLDPGRSSRFLSRKTALYLEVPTHVGWDEDVKPYVSVLMVKSTIITIHRTSGHTINEIVGQLDADAPLYSQSASALLYFFIVEIGKLALEAVLDVRGEAEVLEQRLHENPNDVDPRELASLRRRISHYSSVLDDHTYCTGAMQTVESDALRISEQGKFFHELLRLSDLARVLVNGAESRIAALQHTYEMVLQSQVENRLRFLTILSATFLPLTLISAIYGMNFNDLPAMGAPNGYLVVIGLMIMTVILTWMYFRRTGWFD